MIHSEQHHLADRFGTSHRPVPRSVPISGKPIHPPFKICMCVCVLCKCHPNVRLTYVCVCECVYRRFGRQSRLARPPVQASKFCSAVVNVKSSCCLLLDARPSSPTLLDNTGHPAPDHHTQVTTEEKTSQRYINFEFQQ